MSMIMSHVVATYSASFYPTLIKEAKKKKTRSPGHNQISECALASSSQGGVKPARKRP